MKLNIKMDEKPLPPAKSDGPVTDIGGTPIWRVGSRVPLNVYEGDSPVCQCHNIRHAREIVNAMNQMASVRRVKNPNRHAAGFSLGDWQTDPDMPTMIIDGPLPQAHEIIAQVSSEGNARLIKAAPKMYAELATCRAILKSLHGQGQENWSFSGIIADIEKVLAIVDGTANAPGAPAEAPAGGKP